VSSAYAPLQQRVYDELFAAGRPRPTFAPSCGRELHKRLTAATASIAERLELSASSLWIDKHALDGVHGCERRFLAEEGFPGWSAANAKGTVAHRAIELTMFMTDPPSPLEAVDAAIARIIEDNGDRTPAEFLRAANATELAELRAEASEVVSKFDECFPALPAKWRPRVESPIRHELHGGVITLGARPDLTLGQARGDEARVLIIDFKTGREYHSHVDAMRFYALVATLRLGVPPFRVATFYLDSGTWQHEDVSEDLLELAVRRCTDGMVKLAELRLRERVATITSGPACRYCRVREGCEGAARWAETAGEPTP
jgi:hypothetical protein